MSEDGEDLPLSELKVSRVADGLESAPVLYIDGVQGLILMFGPLGGIAKMNLYADIQNLTLTGQSREADVTRKVVGRLVMSPQTLLSTYDWLTPKIKKLREQLDSLKPAKDADE